MLAQHHQIWFGLAIAPTQLSVSQTCPPLRHLQPMTTRSFGEWITLKVFQICYVPNFGLGQNKVTKTPIWEKSVSIKITIILLLWLTIKVLFSKIPSNLLHIWVPCSNCSSKDQHEHEWWMTKGKRVAKIVPMTSYFTVHYPQCLTTPVYKSIPPRIPILQATVYCLLILKRKKHQIHCLETFTLSVQPKDLLPCFLHEACKIHEELWIWLKSLSDPSGFIKMECQRCKQQRRCEFIIAL